MREEWRSIDQRIKRYDYELAERVRNNPAAKRLIRTPGDRRADGDCACGGGGKCSKHSVVAVTWQRGWDWCRAWRREVENRGCCASASAATVTLNRQTACTDA